MNLDNIMSALPGLNKSELMTLNSAVVEQARRIQAIEARRSMNAFNVGDLVEFDSTKHRRTVRIKIMRLNQKTVTGKEVNPANNQPMFTEWKVPPSMLRHASI